MRSFLKFLFLLASQTLFAQTSPLPMGAANEAFITPTNVNASDGVYDKFVLVRWEADEKASSFRLFRATSASGASMQELTQNWQKSTWFCDYSAEKGRDYYYAVMGIGQNNSTPLSRFDKGFLKKEEKYAQDESLSALSPDKYAAGKQVFVLVSEVRTDSPDYTAGSTVHLSIGLQNIFDESTPRTDLRVYLSSDLVWDFEDKLLSFKSYSGFPANLKASIAESLDLPENLLPGAYHLLIVAAPEGNVLSAKTGVVSINILGQ